MSLQGELFPLISPETVEALVRQWQAELRDILPEMPKDALLRVMGEVSLAREVTHRYAEKIRCTSAYRHRQSVAVLDPATVLAARFSAYRENPPESTSPTLSLVSSSTANRTGRRTPGGRSSRSKWRRSSTASKPA